MRSQYRYLADGEQMYYGEDDPPPPLTDDPDDDLDFQPSPEAQEAEANARMSSGDVPGGQYFGPGGDYTYVPGVGPVSKQDMGPAPLPIMSRPIPAPTVNPPRNWMQRIGDRVGLGNGQFSEKDGSPFGAPGMVGSGQMSYPDVLHREQAAIAQMPVRHAPNWLERVAAGAMGAAAGYSNAAGRARPIDIGKATQGILYPGYDSKLAEWQSRVAPLEKAAEIAGQIQAAGFKGQQVAAESALKGAQVDMNRQRALYYQHLAQQNRLAPVPVTKEMEEATQGWFKVGQTIPAAQAAKLAEIVMGRYDKPERTIRVTDPDFAKRLGVDVGTAVPYTTYNAAINANTRTDLSVPALRMAAAKGDTAAMKAVRGMDDEQARTALASRPPRDPLTDVLIQERIDNQRQGALDAILQKKTQEEQQVKQQRISALQGARLIQDEGARKVQTDAINRKAQSDLQAIQDGYAAKWRGRGLQTPDYNVQVGPDGSIQYAPRTNPYANANPYRK